MNQTNDILSLKKHIFQYSFDQKKDFLKNVRTLDYVEEIKPDGYFEKRYHNRLKRIYINSADDQNLPPPKLKYGLKPEVVDNFLTQIEAKILELERSDIVGPEREFYQSWLDHQLKLGLLINASMNAYIYRTTTLSANLNSFDYQNADSLDVDNLNQNFIDLAQELYGHPGKEFFKTILDNVYSRVQRSEIHQNIKEQLLVQLPKPKSTSIKLDDFLPETSTLTVLKKQALDYFDPIINFLPEKTPKGGFSPAVVAKYFRQAVSVLGLDYQVKVINSANSSISVSHHRKLVIVPADRQIDSALLLRQLVVHEIGTHVLRPVLGSKLGFDLFSIGFNHSLAYEEGLCIALEQIIGGEFNLNHRSIFRLLRVGLALGLDREDGVGRSFQEIFEILWKVYYVLGVSEDRKSARSEAFEEAYRTFRGGDPNFPGSVHPKDIHYLLYSLKALNQLQEPKLPNGRDFKENLSMLLSAKIDASDQKQVDYLNQYLDF